ncbi:MAG: tyrosine-protein phosphatase [Halieaceae bacterium]|nr:tyrosine-protein phosphatase [Halieaceae bacterium]
MTRKKLFWIVFTVLALAVTVIQFIPPEPVVVPAQLPLEQRDSHRLLNFEGIHNLRDLGGYATSDGRQVQWGKLYRSANFAEATPADLAALSQLGLATFIDLRSTPEKAEEPNRLPDPLPFEVVEIPILDEGNQALVGEVMERVENGDFQGFDPGQKMQQANRQFASVFTPQFRQLFATVVAADGAPVLWHCTAGKDRTGFAAAVLLRILGVPRETIMQDYMASLEPALASRKSQLLMLRLFKGEETAAKIEVMMGVEPAWLEAGFDEIDATWGSFDAYVRDGLQLDEADIEVLRANLLQAG